MKKKKKEEEDEKDTRRRERNKTSEGENERKKKNGGDATEAEVGNHSSMHEVTVETCNVCSDMHDPGEED